MKRKPRTKEQLIQAMINAILSSPSVFNKAQIARLSETGTDTVTRHLPEVHKKIAKIYKGEIKMKTAGEFLKAGTLITIKDTL